MPASHSAPPAFDVCGVLPTGTTVVEASAGTGKTFTIAALAARYLAEGHARLDELMLVTFSRSATRELRERVRSRLLSAEAGLADPQQARASPDTVMCHLAQADDAEVVVRRRRLAAALSRFDAATIATTHEFCHQMLVRLGVSGDVERGEVFVESLEDLVEEVTDDLYLRKFAAPDAAPPPISRACALEVAQAAVNDPHAVLAPFGAAEGSEADVRMRLALAVRREVQRRKRLRRLFSYDDQLTRLAGSLTDPVSGPAACERLRSRFRVALVDEFQDTDPVQWEILRHAFHGYRTLVLIGDPKQAIYAFRGADVLTYLRAAAAAGTTATLSTNWRSDQSLIDALDVLFAGAALGDPRIVHRRVRAAHEGSRLFGGPVSAPLRLRIVGRGQVRSGKSGLPYAEPARNFVAADVASDIARLLAVAPRLVDHGAGDHGAGSGGTRLLRPADVAVLTRTNSQADLVREALREVGVPAVITGTSSVFATVAAWQWQVLLEALEQPQRSGRIRSAALTSFLGWSAHRLATAGEDAADDLGVQLHRWSDLLAGQGLAALFETMSVTWDLPARVLAGVDGERQMTDLRHVGQALHEAAVEGGLGISALVSWLRRRRGEAGEDVTEERSRRLDSDAEAVQV
ncbi:MAG: UvrD-helicase domain-containing protein, partial [Frankiaceae bacterium]